MLQGIYDFIKGIFEPLGQYLIASNVPVASSFADDIDSLIALIAVLVVFWALLAYAAFFFLIFRFRDTGQRAQYVTGAKMRPFSMTLPNEQAMKDVIAYIGTLSE